MQNYLSRQEYFPSSTGFVPTMGALHEGHLELVKQCKQAQQLTLSSIFVNPTQFNDPADFKKYPVTIEKDISLLEEAGCDILFLPSVLEIYPGGISKLIHYELGSLENILEGFYRPGHFQGVCRVVHRLLDIVKTAHIYLGRKDYQQCMVIKKMLELTGLNVQVHIVPTVREPDGLAMSSRNIRLDEAARKQAVSIYKQLNWIKNEIGNQPMAALKETATGNLLNDGFSKVDYVAIAEPDSLVPLEKIAAGDRAVVLIAAFLKEVRLIDNMEVSLPR